MHGKDYHPKVYYPEVYYRSVDGRVYGFGSPSRMTRWERFLSHWRRVWC